MERDGHPARCGIVVKRREALDVAGEPVGTHLGAPIFRRVALESRVYRFASVVPEDYKRWIGENELYLEPGLLYVRVP